MLRLHCHKLRSLRYYCFHKFFFDDYARNGLTAEERQRFVGRYGDATDRLTFAKALAERFAWQRRRIDLRTPLALAAAIVLAVGGAYLVMRRPPPPPRALASARPPSPPTAVIALTLGASRAAARETPVVVLRRAEIVEIRVRLNPADRYDRYSMTLRSAGDRLVWRVDDLRASTIGGDLTVVGSAPASAVADDRYELAVRGGDEDLGFVTLQVTRTP